VLAEYPLDRYDVRCVLGYEFLDTALEFDQPLIDRQVGIGAQHPDMAKRDLAPG